MNTKAEWSIEKTVSIIIGLITLLVISFFISNVMDEGKLENAERSCSTIFSKASTSAIFDKEDDVFKEAFWRSTAGSCSSFETIVEKDNPSKGASFLNRCWKMTGGDSDFLPPAYKGGVCMYCGKIKYQGENYGEFREKLSEELSQKQYSSLFETQEVTSLNSLLLTPNTFPVELNQNNSLGVIMYAYKGKFSTWENIKSGTINQIANAVDIVGAEGAIREIQDSFKSTQKGIALVEMNGDTPQVNGNPIDEEFQCDMIVPKNSISY